MNTTATINDLSPREQQIAELYACGLTKKEIAVVNGTSPHTVGNQVKNIFLKLGIRKDTELSAWYFCTRYNISLDIPDAARRFIALCMLALVGLTIGNEGALVRSFRTGRGRRNETEIYL